jgi:hypothetical protein
LLWTDIEWLTGYIAKYNKQSPKIIYSVLSSLINKRKQKIHKEIQGEQTRNSNVNGYIQCKVWNAVL